MIAFAHGYVSALCLVAALFFLRFRRQTNDRFFSLFSVAFLVLGVHWLALGSSPDEEIRPLFYALRASAFVIIATAIIDKNRHRGPGSRASSPPRPSRLIAFRAVDVC